MMRLARWDDDSLPIASPNNLRVQYSGCWGMAINNHEFAILGGARHVLVFDVTTPTQPQLIGKFEGKSNTVWREFKSYKNRIYGVSDGTTEGLMILDFTNAPDTIIQTYFSNALFNSAHTITLDTTSGRIYLNGTNVANQGLLVLDISQNPDIPTVLASTPLTGGYIHDSYVRNDTVYASSGYGGFFVYDFTNPNNPITLASLPATGGYHHNNWLSTDGRYAYATEEIPAGRPILIIDLEDLANANIEVAGSFLHPLLPGGGPNAIPHNVYIKDKLLFDSQYEDGLLVYDISDPLQPKLQAYYDTHPQNTQYNSYYGCWGNYPWLPSGTIIAGDMQNGLQLLRITGSNTTLSPQAQEAVFKVFPNPASGMLNFSMQAPNTTGYVRLLGASGNTVWAQSWPSGQTSLQVPTQDFPAGVYFAEFYTEKSKTSSRLIIIR